MALTQPDHVLSHFQDVIRCNVCNEEVGQLHCDTCQVYICKSCTGTHVTSDLSKQHLVVECKKRSKIKLTECKTHISQRCELYCKQCHVSVCSKCMASTHANHSVIDIRDFCKTKQEEIRKENEEIKTSKISALEKAKLELKTQIQNLPKQLDEIKIQVTKHGKVWHNQIDAIIKQFTSELEEMKKTYLDGMRDHQQKLDDHILLCRQILDDNANVLHSNVLSSFNEYKSRIKEIQDIPLRVDIKLPKFHSAKLEVHKMKNQFGSLQAGSLNVMSVVDKQARPEEPMMVSESPTREANVEALNLDLYASILNDKLETFQYKNAFEIGGNTSVMWGLKSEKSDKSPSNNPFMEGTVKSPSSPMLRIDQQGRINTPPYVNCQTGLYPAYPGQNPNPLQQEPHGIIHTTFPPHSYPYPSANDTPRVVKSQTGLYPAYPGQNPNPLQQEPHGIIHTTFPPHSYPYSSANDLPTVVKSQSFGRPRPEQGTTQTAYSYQSQRPYRLPLSTKPKPEASD